MLANRGPWPTDVKPSIVGGGLEIWISTSQAIAVIFYCGYIMGMYMGSMGIMKV